MVQGTQKITNTISVKYFRGSDLHFLVLSHAKEIMGMLKTTAKNFPLNDLKKISDSVMLGTILLITNKMVRVLPSSKQYAPGDELAKKPKLIEVAPARANVCQAGGFYMLIEKQGGAKQALYLVTAVALAFFFLLFRVWPEWLRIFVFNISYYLLVLLIGVAILRLIVWFALFHLGIDFWIFPNYFIDSNDIMDSFRPALEVEKREDMFDVRMIVLRIASLFAICYGANEFLKDPQNIDDLLSGATDISGDIYDWSQNKFMGVPDNSTAVQTKKSAREIYAEAFMEDESMFKSNTREYADEEALKEEFEKKK